MKILSINVGLPKEVKWKGQTVITGIFKSPAKGVLKVDKINIFGDKQADLKNHGGINKAIYLYPFEHYQYWKETLNVNDLPFGAFGENLTTLGILESEINIGDYLKIGTAEFAAVQPRLPCYKLGIRFNDAAMVAKFYESKRFGIYLKVTKAGKISPGDEIEIISRDPGNIKVAEIINAYVDRYVTEDFLSAASKLKVLPRWWKEEFKELYEKLIENR